MPRAGLAALAGFAAFAFMLIVPTALRDGDTGWHLATGDWILSHHVVPRTDPFSFTAIGHPWVAHEWLSELAMSAFYRAGGWSGLILLFGLALGLLYAVMAHHLLRWMRPGAMVAALVIVTAGLLPSLLARPHMLALPVLAVWLIALLRAREAGRAPPPGWAALMLVWANMHGSFVLGLALAALFAGEALIAAAPDERREVVLRWGGFGLLSLVAAMLTPSGVHGLTFPFYVDRLALLPYLGEWQPADFKGPSLDGFVLLGGLAFLLARPIRIPPLRLLLMLGLLYLALEHARQMIVLVVIGPLVLAEPLGLAWRRTVIAGPRPDTAGQATPLLAIVAILALALTAFRFATPIVRPDSASVPGAAIRAVPPALRTRPVFNEYGFGGPLIFAGIRPYIDGRSDMYGDPFTIDYFRISRGDVARWQAADRRWRFAWTILPPRSPVVARLDRDPAWRRLYADPFAVIHVWR